MALEELSFVSVTTWDFVDPTVTLPKGSAVGFNDNTPLPTPLSAMVWLPFAASLLIVAVPLNLTSEFGVNEIVKFAL